VDDQLRPISAGTTSGSITRDYIFLGSQRIAMVPLSSGNPYYYLSDRLGSTAIIASGDGKTIQWEADYFPFGSVQQMFTNLWIVACVVCFTPAWRFYSLQLRGRVDKWGREIPG
jgi:hypothetical protein